MAKFAAAQLLSFNNGSPFRMVLGIVTDAEFVTLRWKGEGGNMSSEDLMKNECYTRITLSWFGGSGQIKLPCELGDVSKSIPDEAFLLALIPQKDKRGQLRDIQERTEVVGCGLSDLDVDLNPELMSVPGAENGLQSSAA